MELCLHLYLLLHFQIVAQSMVLLGDQNVFFVQSVPHIATTTSSRKANEAIQELPFSKLMQMDRGNSVSTQVYSRCNSVGNRRNRVHERKASSSEGRVSVCANWPPDALFVREIGSHSSDKAKSFDPALFEAQICGQAFSNTIVSLARNVVVSHQVHRVSVIYRTEIAPAEMLSPPPDICQGVYDIYKEL
ncbi:hypothetical protein Cgig2_027652 [Carnegiea gigantea]|uniref:Uncharacterized protein n=1 Tax=Carnegiea gigantea TaxID=171969 RepID=A0A9Q1GQ06_9CARY|nr:hypothetical protein Cgig2_027652 [Carnegiea gigantea]